MGDLGEQAQKFNLPLHEYTQFAPTLFDLSNYFNPNQKFALVGSLANRLQFPDFYKENASKVGDIDLVMQIPLHSNPVNASLTDKYSLLASYKQFEGYSLFLVHSESLVKINIFIAEKPIQTETVVIGHKEWPVASRAEIFLKVMRDIFTFAAKHQPNEEKWRLNNKHREFYKFLISSEGANILSLYPEQIANLWPIEVLALQANAEFERSEPNTHYSALLPATLASYLEIINHLITIEDNFFDSSVTSAPDIITQDNRDQYARQEPWGLHLASSEEYVRLRNKSIFKA